MTQVATQAPKPWKEYIVYQIYPASFKDSNGDGMGDIPGIISKLDYLQELGVTCLWISPFFKSPQYDLGYDISDFSDVHEAYGTVADVEALIKGAHDRGMKVLFDLVVNHTSHEHKWFQESRSSKDNPKRDWFIWKPATYVDGERRPPNNWKAAFGGSVWEWDELTEEYYLHFFLKEQPDLNWELPEVREAIYEDACHFWLRRGVDGFRIDVVCLYSKLLDFPDAKVTEPHTPWQTAWDLMSHGPRIHEYIGEMAEKCFEPYDVMTVGECGLTRDLQHILQYVGASQKQLSSIFSFEHFGMINSGLCDSLEWDLPQWKKICTLHQDLTKPELDAWSTVFLENHDAGRAVSRYANDSPEHRVACAKTLAIYNLTQSGTPYIYQGQEIGMVNAPKDWPIEEYIDCYTIGAWEDLKVKAKGDQAILDKGMAGIQKNARDHARTPMHWDTSEYAGFSPAGSKTKPWMRVMESYKEINVADQSKDPHSPLAFYKEMIALRKQHTDVFVYGAFEVVDLENKQTMSFIKTGKTERMLVSLNFTDKAQDVGCPAGEDLAKATLLATSANSTKASGPLGPYEGRVYLL